MRKERKNNKRKKDNRRSKGAKSRIQDNGQRIRQKNQTGGKTKATDWEVGMKLKQQRMRRMLQKENKIKSDRQRIRQKHQRTRQKQRTEDKTKTKDGVEDKSNGKRII